MIGHNAEIDLKDRSNTEAVNFVVSQLVKLKAEHKQAAETFRNYARKQDAAKGLQRGAFAEAVRMTYVPAPRLADKLARFSHALEMLGRDVAIGTTVGAVSPEIQKGREYLAEVHNVAERIKAVCDAAKDFGLVVPVMKLIARFAAVDANERHEFFSEIDHMRRLVHNW